MHSSIQSNILVALRRKYPHLKVVVWLRSKTAATRYRIPDVTVLLAPPTTRYLLEAAFLVVEGISKRDVLSVTIGKFKEYAAKGVPNIWPVSYTHLDVYKRQLQVRGPRHSRTSV